jgi:hypothetical protein
MTYDDLMMAADSVITNVVQQHNYFKNIKYSRIARFSNVAKSMYSI